MAYRPPRNPLSVREAFSTSGGRAAQSQAALLLTLANLLRYPDPRFEETVAASHERDTARAMPLEEDEREQLGIPFELLRLGEARGSRFDVQFVRQSTPLMVSEVSEELLSRPDAEERAGALLPLLADGLLSNPEPLRAAALIDASMASKDELVRVAAAAAQVEIVLEHQTGPAVDVLLRGTYSGDPLVRDIAATALARVVPGHARLIELIQRRISPLEGGEAHTSLLVHGTWARGNSWWQPNGDFHTYVRQNVDSSVYSGLDRFDWSGGWSDHARALAAIELMAWLQDKQLACVDLFTHSHGGSVAMLASKVRKIGRLVMLSCPVHRHKYWPNFAKVQRAISIRVHADLVILADGGEQRFHDPGIEEIVLPLWFNHSTSHDPSTWQTHGLAGQIGAPIC